MRNAVEELTTIIINTDVVEKLKEFNRRDEMKCIEERMGFMNGVKCYADSASVGYMIYLSERE